MIWTALPRKILDRWFSPERFNFNWRTLVSAILLIYMTALAWETTMRVIFPWDMLVWAESPFMTNMLKLHHGSPIYTDPADVNSFVYSPGLDYLTFGVLKPFGQELDIRYCRLVNVLLGMAAALCGALALLRLARSCPELGMGRWGFLATGAAVLLVLFKNFTADIPHPDNLHTLHALLVFVMCFAAVEKKHFGLALATMILAGMGVLTKQTDALCFIGAAMAFGILNPWGWRRWFILSGVGSLMFALSLWWMWRPPYAQFYTFKLMSQQGISFTKLAKAAYDLAERERLLVILIGICAVPLLWNLKGAARRYLICWMTIGAAAILPNAMAYLKRFGVWNNLAILEVWLVIIAWPLVWNLPGFWKAAQKNANPMVQAKLPNTYFLLAGLSLAFVLSLVPFKAVPRISQYKYCEAIENAVNRDVQANRKVWVTHGAEFLVRAGNTDVPLDRANSFLELLAGKASSVAKTDDRIKSHYYDRVYVLTDNWYDEQINADLDQNYEVTGDILAETPRFARDFENGFQTLLWTHCKILSVRAK